MLHLARRGGATRLLARSLSAAAGKPYAQLSVGVPKETVFLERRVSQTPETVAGLVKEGFVVKVERGAGAAAAFPDAAYVAAGAELVDAAGAFGASIVTKVAVPTAEEAKSIGDRTLIGFFWPAQVRSVSSLGAGGRSI
ncbi:alanine dehydrogenase/PNT, N-terminal domain-containing protein [Pavlovales sp. CCMP2436]|nr:alanine dehydrogenase/PNT, N-terminal domain-containing protein [Pavlovales sp. CCMP2436]